MNSQLNLIPIPSPLQSQIGQDSRPSMYAISLTTGGHEHSHLTMISVTDDFCVGSAWVNKMNTLYKSLLKKRHLLALATIAWRALQPMPTDSGNTAAMQQLDTLGSKEDRHRVNNENFLTSLSARALHHQWLRDEMAFAKTWLEKHLTPDEALLESTANENVWSIQSIAWHPIETAN